MPGMAQIQPLKPRVTLKKLDGRTKEARLMRETRAELLAHVGGRPSATQRQLIERAVMLTLQVAVLDAKTMANGGAMTMHDSNQYLAWSNSLTRTLRQLGLKGVAERPLTIADYIASQAAS